MENETKHVCEPVYVCEGECGAKLSVEEYQAHDTKVCGTENCSRKGQPFAMKECGEEGSTCPNC